MNSISRRRKSIFSFLRSGFQTPRSPLASRSRLRVESLESRDLLALVSYWSGDNTAVDSVSGNNGTLQNGATYTSGQVNQAFKFDGVDDRVLVADSPSLALTQSLSLEAWVRVDGFSVTSESEIVFRGDDRGGLDPYKLDLAPGGTLQFVINSATGQGVSVYGAIPTGQFVHIAATLDDSTGLMALYENGVQIAHLTTSVRPFGLLDPTQHPGLGIGNGNSTYNAPLQGAIDEVRIYDHALTPADVHADFLAGKGATSISVSDASAIEGSTALKVLDRFVNQGSGLTRPRTPVFGPDGNGDGVQDLYVANADTNEVLRFDGNTGTFIDAFVTANSGGLLSPADMVFGPDGNLYVSSIGNIPGMSPPAGQGSILRYDGATGAFIDAVATGLSNPLGIIFGPDGSLFVAEQDADEVDRFSGGVKSVFVSPGSGGLDAPRNVLFGPDVNGDGHADLYVSSNLYDGVLRYDGQTGAFIDKFVSTGLAHGPAWMQFAPDGTLVTSAATTSQCCYQSYERFNGVTGAKIDQLDSPTLGWSFKFGPDGLIYSSGNGMGNYVDREGAASLVSFTVSLNYPSDVPVTVNYSTANGTATAGADYQAASGTITFAPGQTSRSVLIPTYDDTAVEGNETFTVTLSNPVGAPVSRATGTATITDNEIPPTKFYVVNDGSPDRTYEYAASGAAIENYTINSGNTAPRGAASNAKGDTVWVVDANKNVYVYNTSGGLLGSWAAGSLPSNANVQGVTTNGTDVWIVDNKGDKVYKYSGAASRISGSQTAASSFSLSSSNTNASDLVTDGTSIWVVDNGSSTDKVFKYTVSGSLLGSWTISGAGGSPTGITIDPSNVSDIWIVDSSSRKIYDFAAAAGRTSGNQSPASNLALAAGNTNPQGIADPPVPSVSGLSTPLTSSSTDSDFDSALLSIVGELDGWLSGGKKRT